MGALLKGALAALAVSFLSASVVYATTCSAGTPSGSALLQLVDISDDCRPVFEAGTTQNRNALFAKCGTSIRVVIGKTGAVALTPAVTETYEYIPDGDGNMFNCSWLNASGTAAGKEPTTARIRFYNNKGAGRKPSTLTVMRGGFLNLSISGTYPFETLSHIPQPLPVCWIKYQVTSGCILGVKAAAKPYACPLGTFIKKGRFGNYCSLCPEGLSSFKLNSKTCSACPKGTANPNAGGKCSKCKPGFFADREGTQLCSLCTGYDAPGSGPEAYTSDGITCKRCPPDSYSLNSAQCVACREGKKCCRAGASATCPACPKGLKSANSGAAKLVFTSASPPSCALNSILGLCSPTITAFIRKDCKVVTSSSSPLDGIFGASCFLKNIEPAAVSMNGSKARISDVLPVLQFVSPEDWPGKPPVVSHGVISYTINFPKDVNLGSVIKTQGVKCRFDYRVVSTPSPNPFPFSPTPCSPGSPGCVSKSKPPMCGPGFYISRTACVPCPPGQFKAARNSATKCIPCAKGTAAFKRYASTKCT